MRARLHKPKTDHSGTHQSIIRRKVRPRFVQSKPAAHVNFPTIQLNKPEKTNSRKNVVENKEPPIILKALEYAKKRSVTFAVLMQRNGITINNYSEIISLSSSIDSQGDTDPDTRKIRIKSTTEVTDVILVLTHEMTNRLLCDKFIVYRDLVAKGEITPKQFAKKWAELEKEGQINQLKVAAQIGHRYGDENIDNLLEQYENDQTTDIRKRSVANTMHLQRYEELGIKLRKRYLSQKANIQTVEGVANFRFDSNVAKKSEKGNYFLVKDIYSGKQIKVIRDSKTGKYSKYEN